jgi:hypothetical protein
MLAAMRVKSPFSQSALLGFIALLPILLSLWRRNGDARPDRLCGTRTIQQHDEFASPRVAHSAGHKV